MGQLSCHWFRPPGLHTQGIDKHYLNFAGCMGEPLLDQFSAEAVRHFCVQLKDSGLALRSGTIGTIGNWLAVLWLAVHADF